MGPRTVLLLEIRVWAIDIHLCKSTFENSFMFGGKSVEFIRSKCMLVQLQYIYLSVQKSSN